MARRGVKDGARARDREAGLKRQQLADRLVGSRRPARRAWPPPARRTCGDGWSAPGARAPRNARAPNSPYGARSRSPGCARPSRTISRSRVTLATIEAAAIDSTSASPDTTAWQSQPHIDLHVAVDEDELRRAPAAPSPRAPAPTARRARCCRGRCARPSRMPPPLARVAQIFSYSFSRSARVELLGIVEPARDALGIEDDRRRHHRAGERPPARLVAAGDRKDALGERAPLAPEARAQDRLVERQALRRQLWRGHCPRTMRGAAAMSMRRQSRCGWR